MAYWKTLDSAKKDCCGKLMLTLRGSDCIIYLKLNYKAKDGK